LPNRTLFRDRVEQELAVSHRQNLRFALIFLDLDRFKAVNDQLGHDAGDELLRQVATRLCASVRESDTVARLGGDEFITLLRGILQPEDAELIARNMVMTLAASFNLSGAEVEIGASIGIALYPEHGRDFDTLVKCADQAMYHAKHSGRGCYQFYGESLAAAG